MSATRLEWLATVNINTAIVRAGLTVDEVSQRTGVDVQVIRGERELMADDAYHLSRALGCTLDEFYRETVGAA